MLGYVRESDFTITSSSYYLENADFTNRWKVICKVSKDQNYVALSGNSLNSSPALVRIFSIINLLTSPNPDLCRYNITSNDVADIAWC
jgi:hypothetical protein